MPLVHARHVHFSKIAEKLNRGGDEASREQSVRRQLDHETMGTWQRFRPRAECLLKSLVGRSVYLILDPAWTTSVVSSWGGWPIATGPLPLIWMSFESKPERIADRLTLLFTERKP